MPSRAVDALLAERSRGDRRSAAQLTSPIAVQRGDAARHVNRTAPHLPLSVSFEWSSPEIKEYERTSTTSFNAM